MKNGNEEIMNGLKYSICIYRQTHRQTRPFCKDARSHLNVSYDSILRSIANITVSN